MSTVISGYQGKAGNQVLLKGAPERVISKCTKVMTSSGEEKAFSENEKQKLNQ